MDIIISKENPRFKLAKSLLSRKHRETHELCVVEGIRLVNHIRQMHPQLIQTVYLDALAPESLQDSFPEATLLSETLFRELSETVHSQGVIALVKTAHLDQSLDSKLILALDGIQDPGNLGTIIRTCDAVGDVGLIVAKGCVDLYNPKVIRGAMGSLFDVAIQRNCDLLTELHVLKKRGYRIVGAALEGAKNMLEFEWEPKTVLIIGNEGNGISQAVLDFCDEKVIIPLSGKAESLNAAVAAGILIYDAHRNI